MYTGRCLWLKQLKSLHSSYDPRIQNLIVDIIRKEKQKKEPDTKLASRSRGLCTLQCDNPTNGKSMLKKVIISNKIFWHLFMNFKTLLLKLFNFTLNKPFSKVGLKIMLTSAIKSSELYASIYHVHHLQQQKHTSLYPSLQFIDDRNNCVPFKTGIF